MVAVDDDRPAEALAAAREALDLAVVARDWFAYVHAVLWEMNASAAPSSEAAAELLRRRRAQLAAEAAPHSHVARLSAVEAESWLMIGDWRSCQAAGDPGL